jgi:hypothetical protein
MKFIKDSTLSCMVWAILESNDEDKGDPASKIPGE